MRTIVLLLALVPLVGCAQPTPALEPMPEECEGSTCSVETLNATIVPKTTGEYHVGIPVPAFGMRRTLPPWGENATLEGNGTVALMDFGGGPVLYVRATGPVTLRTRVVEGAQPETLVAEGYLDARWTTSPEVVAPSAVRVWVSDEGSGIETRLREVTIEYEARSSWCGRSAHFRAIDLAEGWTNATGKDGAVCS